MFKKFLLFISFILFISFFGIVKAGFNYPYVCFSATNCNETRLWEIDVFSPGKFIDNAVITKVVNFRNKINSKLNGYKIYYGNLKFTINNYIGSTSTDTPINKDFKLSQLFSENSTFYVGIDEYSSGKDYFFSNFSDIITQLNIAMGFGFPTNLSSFYDNVIGYDKVNDELILRNVCDDILCYNSIISNIGINNTNTYYFLSGDIENYSNFSNNNFVVTNNANISTNLLNADEVIDFTFRFDDYLDVSSLKTKYKYKVHYKYQGGLKILLLEEDIEINNSIMDFTTDTKDALGNVIDRQIINSGLKKIRIGLTEKLRVSKVGKITFWFEITNLNTGDTTGDQEINPFIPVKVIPSNDISANTLAEITSPVFTEVLNNIGYNSGSTFTVKLNIKDLYDNNHFDYIDGYDISLSSGSSPDIKLAKSLSPIFTPSLIGVKSDIISPYDIYFKFHIQDYGFHILNGFDIKSRHLENTLTYKFPVNYSMLTNVVPSNLYDGVNQKMNIYIKPPTISDFPISCTNTSITLDAICDGDNFSGCNTLANQSITFSSEADNGTMGSLTIQDYAFNKVVYNYNMNHIDKTAPTIKVFLGVNELFGNNYNYKANGDIFTIKFLESTTSDCSPEIIYEIKINGVITNTGTQAMGSFPLNLSNLLKSSGNKIVDIKVTDKYGNETTKTITFSISPGDLDESMSILELEDPSLNGTKYANYSDFYKYILTLKDQFGNRINSKKLLFINQDCSGNTSCKSIQNDVFDSSSPDSLKEFGYIGIQTDINGKISLKIKSTAPGIFNERLKVKLYNWDENYNNTTLVNSYIIGGTNTNGFKKLFKGELLVSSNSGTTWDAHPDIGTSLLYKLKITGVPHFVLTKSTSLNDFKNYIRVSDDINTTIQGVSNILGLSTKELLFSARINTSSGSTSLGNAGINISIFGFTPIDISYILNGESIKHYLSSNQLPGDKSVIKFDIGSLFLGVEVIGGLEGAGKGTITGQKENYSNMNKIELRRIITKNAYNLISGLSSGTEINNIKYVLGDTTISGDQTYETLIVVDGNLTISGDINPSNNKMGIIVIGKDGKGNIYIDNNVTEINAIIYSEGGLISSKNGIPYSLDSVQRSTELDKQLILNGSLFSRNTIGGSILVGGFYLLPGNKKTGNFDESMVYDLNYIRRGNKGCDKDSDGNCTGVGEHEAVFIIKYNPTIQIDPPKGFYN